jgi:hypothetical protein
MRDNPLSKEMSAAIQVRLPKTALRLADKMRFVDDRCALFREGGLVRSLNERRYGPLRVAGVATGRSYIPAFGGVLYGVVAVSQTMLLEDKHVRQMEWDSRVLIDDLDWLSYRQRLRWKEYGVMYQLLAALLDQDTGLDLILVNNALLISPREITIGTDDEQIQQEWEDLKIQMTEFWTHYRDRLYPRGGAGPALVSIGQRPATAILTALYKGGANATPDEVSEEVITLITEEWLDIRQIGSSRFLNRLMAPQTRSAAFLYTYLGVDSRCEPDLLRRVGLTGMYVRAGLRAPLWQLEFVGNYDDWTPSTLDELARDVISATLFDHTRSMPLPLWYALQACKFPKGYLEFYRRAAWAEMPHIIEDVEAGIEGTNMLNEDWAVDSE